MDTVYTASLCHICQYGHGLQLAYVTAVVYGHGLQIVYVKAVVYGHGL